MNQIKRMHYARSVLMPFAPIGSILSVPIFLMVIDDEVLIDQPRKLLWLRKW